MSSNTYDMKGKMIKRKERQRTKKEVLKEVCPDSKISSFEETSSVSCSLEALDSDPRNELLKTFNGRSRLL